MQLNWRNKKLQTWNLLNLMFLRVWNKNIYVDVGISPLFISDGFAVLFKQINLIRNQRCFVQDWYGGWISFFKIPVVSLSNLQIGIKCSVGCEVFLCTVKAIDQPRIFKYTQYSYWNESCKLCFTDCLLSELSVQFLQTNRNWFGKFLLVSFI